MLAALRLLVPSGNSFLCTGLLPLTAKRHLGSHAPFQDPVHEANQEINQAFGLSQEATISTTTTISSRSSNSSNRSSQHTNVAAASVGGTDAPRLTHIDSQGHANMVDVSNKAETVRSATAACVVRLGPVAFPLVQHNSVAKGNVLATAQLAGIQAAKQTSHLIPLCHNILLTKVDVQLALQPQEHSVHISSRVHTVGRTGVEMEALTAASVAALTVYDMCKAASKDIEITGLRLESKSGGRSGDYHRQSAAGGAA